MTCVSSQGVQYSSGVCVCASGWVLYCAGSGCFVIVMLLLLLVLSLLAAACVPPLCGVPPVHLTPILGFAAHHLEWASNQSAHVHTHVAHYSLLSSSIAPLYVCLCWRCWCVVQARRCGSTWYLPLMLVASALVSASVLLQLLVFPCHFAFVMPCSDLRVQNSTPTTQHAVTTQHVSM